MTVENIKSFREYLEEQKNIENTILEDENGSESGIENGIENEAPSQDKRQEKNTSLADKYYNGKQFTTTPEVKKEQNAVDENKTPNDKK